MQIVANVFSSSLLRVISTERHSSVNTSPERSRSIMFVPGWKLLLLSPTRDVIFLANPQSVSQFNVNIPFD